MYWSTRSTLGLLVGGFAALAATSAQAADPWADRVVYDHGATTLTTGPFLSSNLWDDPEAVVGKVNTLDRDDRDWTNPTFREIHMAWGPWYQGTNDVALSGQPYSQATTTNNGVGLSAGAQVVVEFDEPIVNNADDGGAYNWGVDFLVHGNATFGCVEGYTYPNSNMEQFHIAGGGGVFAEPVTVSVAQSLDGPWYAFASPTADNYFPTQAYAWDWDSDDWSTQEMDWTKPVNPNLTGADFGGLSVAEAIDLYDGSAGGTGFDLDAVGLDWIKYVMISDPSGNGGEVTGVVDVAVPEPGALVLLLLGAACARRRA